MGNASYINKLINISHIMPFNPHTRHFPIIAWSVMLFFTYSFIFGKHGVVVYPEPGKPHRSEPFLKNIKLKVKKIETGPAWNTEINMDLNFCNFCLHILK